LTGTSTRRRPTPVLRKAADLFSWLSWIIDFVHSALAFSLERRHAANKGDGWLLFHIWAAAVCVSSALSLVSQDGEAGD